MTKEEAEALALIWGAWWIKTTVKSWRGGPFSKKNAATVRASLRRLAKKMNAEGYAQLAREMEAG